MNYYYLSVSDAYFSPSLEVISKINKYDENACFLICGIELSHSHTKYLNENFKCEFFSMPTEIKDKIKTMKWPKELFFKYFLAYYTELSIKKVLCVGADMTVQRSLIPIFSINMNNYPIAAAIENSGNLTKRFDSFEKLPADRLYFNAEVELLNLDYFRENYCIEEIIAFIGKHQDEFKYADQDFANLFFYQKYKPLNFLFNFQITEFLRSAFFEQGLNNAYIYHFSSRPKPWDYRSTPKIIKLYLKNIQRNTLFRKKLQKTLLLSYLYFPFGKFKLHVLRK